MVTWLTVPFLCTSFTVLLRDSIPPFAAHASTHVVRVGDSAYSQLYVMHVKTKKYVEVTSEVFEQMAVVSVSSCTSGPVCASLSNLFL